MKAIDDRYTPPSASRMRAPGASGQHARAPRWAQRRAGTIRRRGCMARRHARRRSAVGLTGNRKRSPSPRPNNHPAARRRKRAQRSPPTPRTEASASAWYIWVEPHRFRTRATWSGARGARQGVAPRMRSGHGPRGGPQRRAPRTFGLSVGRRARNFERRLFSADPARASDERGGEQSVRPQPRME